MLHRVPLKKIGRPEDVAKMVLYLSSENASYITGADFLNELMKARNYECLERK